MFTWFVEEEASSPNLKLAQNAEAEIIKAIGIQTGGKMHTTRSRNDQVILDSKMRTRRGIVELRAKVLDIVQTLLERAKDFVEDVMVSYTHVQHAQPISIAYWLTHYAAIFLRDLDRLKRFVFNLHFKFKLLPPELMTSRMRILLDQVPSLELPSPLIAISPLNFLALQKCMNIAWMQLLLVTSCWKLFLHFQSSRPLFLVLPKNSSSGLLLNSKP